jgi:hypothetical protein
MSDVATSPAIALNTDVAPARGGGWRACCECGRESVHDEQGAAWEWLLSHPCATEPPTDSL